MATLETFPSGTKSISIEVSTPTTAGKHPAVLVVYGTDGLSDAHGFGTALRAFSARLAAEGFVALIPDYFQSTDTTPGADTVWRSPSSSLDTWVASLSDAATFANGRTSVEPGKLGIVGFSLGGNLALRLAKLPSAKPKALAVVDFFAPISQVGGIGTGVDKLPFVQIHHGGDDKIVPPAQSGELMNLLDDAHKKKDVDYFFFPYPGEGHGFSKPQDIKESTDRAIAFLRTYLV
jgi:dienelactone hydrolase